MMDYKILYKNRASLYSEIYELCEEILKFERHNRFVIFDKRCRFKINYLNANKSLIGFYKNYSHVGPRFKFILRSYYQFTKVVTLEDICNGKTNNNYLWTILGYLEYQLTAKNYTTTIQFSKLIL